MDYHIHPSFTERPAPYMALALAGDHPGAAATTPAARAVRAVAARRAIPLRAAALAG